MTQWTNFRQSFEILEIEMTTERRAIKRAYAQMVKKYHPEENPEEWRRVHNAYENAMRYAEWKEKEVEEPTPSESQPRTVSFEPQQKIVPKIAHDEDELDFENLTNIAQHNRIKREQERKDALPVAIELLEVQCAETIQRVKQWKKLLSTPEVYMVRTNATFLYRIGDLLNKRRIDLGVYRVIKGFLKDTHEELVEGIFDDGISSINMEAWNVASRGLEWAFKGKLSEFKMPDIKKIVSRKIKTWKFNIRDYIREKFIFRKKGFLKIDFREIDYKAVCKKHYKGIIMAMFCLFVVISTVSDLHTVDKTPSRNSTEQNIFNQPVRNIDMQFEVQEAVQSEKVVEPDEPAEPIVQKSSNVENESYQEVLSLFYSMNVDYAAESMSNTIKYLKEDPNVEKYDVRDGE